MGLLSLGASLKLFRRMVEMKMPIKTLLLLKRESCLIVKSMSFTGALVAKGVGGIRYPKRRRRPIWSMSLYLLMS